MNVPSRLKFNGGPLSPIRYVKRNVRSVVRTQGCSCGSSFPSTITWLVYWPPNLCAGRLVILGTLHKRAIELWVHIDPPLSPDSLIRHRNVIVGSGWAGENQTEFVIYSTQLVCWYNGSWPYTLGYKLLKDIDTKHYEVVVVSPR
jgi:hypothetical protein